MTVVGFDRVAHLIRVPVRLGDDELHFLVDTGFSFDLAGSRLVLAPLTAPPAH